MNCSLAVATRAPNSSETNQKRKSGTAIGIIYFLASRTGRKALIVPGVALSNVAFGSLAFADGKEAFYLQGRVRELHLSGNMIISLGKGWTSSGDQSYTRWN